MTDYVEDVTNPCSPNFIRVEDRIATFDMDGTFLGELYPTYFEYNMLEYRGLDDPTYVALEQVREAAQNIRDFVRAAWHTLEGDGDIKTSVFRFKAGHPDVEGMKSIASQVLSALK